MTQGTGTSLMERLRQMPDPRIERTRRHALMGILLIAPCAVIGEADNWVDVVQFGKAKKEWFATFLKLPNGMASHGMLLGQLLLSRALPLSGGAQTLAQAMRSHWAVENELHWSLAVSFREDACKVCRDEGLANLACPRRLALTQLQR